MAGITLAQAETKLTSYLAAEEAILTGQRQRFSGGGVDRELTRADLDMVQAGVALWDKRVKQLSRAATGGGLQVREVIPR